MTTILNAYQSTLNVLLRKPVRLWGLSLLCGLLTAIASIGFFGMPIVGIALSIALELGMTQIYLNHYKTGATPDTSALFAAFQQGKFFRLVGGMAWMSLWVLIWCLIPIVGPVFAVIKTYTWRFTPYILLTDSSVKAVDAIKVSAEMTKGLRGKMFLAEFLIGVAYFLITLVLGLLSGIPYIGFLFAIVSFVFGILYSVLLPLFEGLMGAHFYCIANEPASYAAPAGPACPVCGARIKEGQTFCGTCGNKL